MSGDVITLNSDRLDFVDGQCAQSPNANQSAREVTMTGSKLTSAACRLSVFALGMSLGLFLAITFAFCVGFDLIFPYYAMHGAWDDLLPGFVWISWGAFAIGLVETFLYGWFAALIFGPLYNLLASR